jgi:hypothetical protein
VARNSDNLLGMGGQRNTVSRSTLRATNGGTQGGPSDEARERKQELLRKLREKTKSAESGQGEDGKGQE